MSDLVYQNYNNRCQGWSAPSNLFGPSISSLTGYYSPAGSTTLISINGDNFYSYSTVSFGTYKPTTYFINSKIIQFYVPVFLNAGTYPIQVFNGSTPSNSINYTIDNASGYWLLNSNGIIQNANTSLVSVSALSRGAPINITDADVGAPYVIPKNATWIICNITTEVTIVLPLGTSFTGREICMKSINSGLILSNSPNIISLDGSNYSNVILSGLGKWVTLVNDGANWHIMQGN